jgi:copper chaperone CopZ
MKKEIIFVENIKCSGCMTIIKEQLNKIDGVNIITIDQETEQVIISGENLNRQNIVDRLTQLGYPEKGNNNEIAKVKSYVSCAIGKLSSE